MDSDRFDQLSRFLGRGVNRRAALVTLAALGAGGVGEVAAHRRHGTQKHQGRAATKTTICHLDQDTHTYQSITVANSALPAHFAHGDVVDGGCCPGDAAGRCAPGATCQTGTNAQGQPIAQCVATGVCTDNSCITRTPSCGPNNACYCFNAAGGGSVCGAGDGYCVETDCRVSGSLCATGYACVVQTQGCGCISTPEGYGCARTCDSSATATTRSAGRGPVFKH